MANSNSSLGCTALVAATPCRGDAPAPVWTRAELVAAVCATLDAGFPVPAGALACSRGTACEATRLSHGRAFGRAQVRGQTVSHVLCPLCIVAMIQRQVDARTPVRVLPFEVRAGEGPDDVHPCDCHPRARDGELCIAGNMVTLAALAMRWDGARLHADGLGMRDTPRNGGLCAYLYGGARLPWGHLPSRGGLRLVSPLVTHGCDGWLLRSVSSEAGLPHLARGGEAAWEARVAAAWDAQPGRRLWLGALLDAAAVGGDDLAGPWPGDLPDVLAAMGEHSYMAIFNNEFSAAAGPAAEIAVAVKTVAWPAYRRECPEIFAKLVPTTDIWPLLRDAAAHVLLGTWPVPAVRPTLAERRAALRFVAADGGAAWIRANAPLATVAAFYLRYVAERSRGAQWAARGAVDVRFWGEFERVLVLCRGAVAILLRLRSSFADACARSRAAFDAALAAGGGPVAGLVAWAGCDAALAATLVARIAEGKKDSVVHAWEILVRAHARPTDDDRVAAVHVAIKCWISRSRVTSPAPGRGTGAAVVDGGPPAPGRVMYMCYTCERPVQNERGARGPCKVCKRRRMTNGGCCCAAGRACTHRRARGCCCNTKSLAEYNLDTGKMRCRRKRQRAECRAEVAIVPMDRRMLLIPAHGRSAYVACRGCGKTCNYRRAHDTTDGYFCGCTSTMDADPCFVCERTDPGGVWTLARDGAPLRLCKVCEFYSVTLQTLRPTCAPGELRAQLYSNRWLMIARRSQLQGRGGGRGRSLMDV